MTTLFNDSRYGVRSLLKRPAFLAIALVALVTFTAPAPVLRTAANAVVFSAEIALTLHPFTFPNQPQLPILWNYQRALRRLR